MTDDHDPAVRSFLSLLERDLSDHPERLVSLDGMRADLRSVITGAKFALDVALDPDDE